MIGVEVNNHGHAVLQELRRLCCPMLHCSRDPEAGGKTRLGWHTNAKTKPLMIDDLAAAIAQGHLLIRSSFLVDQCLTFVVKDSGDQEAQEGKSDDLVMAAAIAWQVRKRPPSRPIFVRPAGW